jgi:hypothetical protein
LASEVFRKTVPSSFYDPKQDNENDESPEKKSKAAYGVNIPNLSHSVDRKQVLISF